MKNFFGTSEASGGEIEICFVTEWFGLMQKMSLLSDVQLQCSGDVVLEVSVLFSGFILDYYFWFLFVSELVVLRMLNQFESNEFT